MITSSSPFTGALGGSGTTTATIASGTALGRDAALPQAPGGKMGKNEFLKLLVAQLKNQDPLDPQKGEEMAAQLAQFSSLEQLISINSALGGQQTGQAALAASMQSSAALGALGHTVVARGNQVALGAGDDTVRVHVGAMGGQATLRLIDGSGRVVSEQALGAIAGGMREIDVSKIAAGLPAGAYSYELAVTDAAGNQVDVTPYMTGRVDSVQPTLQGAVLIAGGLAIPFADVVEIRK
jgi:flagellar basal-body rod modification protein FlgD